MMMLHGLEFFSDVQRAKLDQIPTFKEVQLVRLHPQLQGWIGSKISLGELMEKISQIDAKRGDLDERCPYQRGLLPRRLSGC
jgi:hypothetical protein